MNTKDLIKRLEGIICNYLIGSDRLKGDIQRVINELKEDQRRFVIAINMPSKFYWAICGWTSHFPAAAFYTRDEGERMLEVRHRNGDLKAFLEEVTE